MHELIGGRAPQPFSPHGGLSAHTTLPAPFRRSGPVGRCEASVRGSSSWRCVLPGHRTVRWARDRRIPGTRILFDVFLSSQLSARETATALPITGMAAWAPLLGVAVFCLAARDAVPLRMRHSRVPYPRITSKRRRSHPARLVHVDLG